MIAFLHSVAFGSLLGVFLVAVLAGIADEKDWWG